MDGVGVAVGVPLIATVCPVLVELHALRSMAPRTMSAGTNAALLCQEDFLEVFCIIVLCNLVCELI